jgi:prolipoprotein diacylglyceryltransferase
LLVYGLVRVGLEYWRDEARVTALGLTMGQLLSLPIALGGLALWMIVPATAALPVRVDASVLATYWPTLPVVFALAFAVCGYHRREVGRW